MRNKIAIKFFGWFKLNIWSHVVVLSVLVGIVAGLGAVAFNFLLEQTDRAAMIGAAGYVMPRAGAEGGAHISSGPTRRILLLFIPAIGGLLTGLLVYSLAPEAEGHGTDAVIEAFHRNRGIVRRRVPFIKTIASVLTIGTGGSAGREGPIGQIGAGFGSALADWLKVGDRERRILMLAGAGAGIGAVFRAPLGGALFITEVLYGDMEFEASALVPTFVASIVGYSLFCAINGTWGPIFSVPTFEFRHPMELPLYLILGLCCAFVGSVYVVVFYGIRDKLFRPLRIPRHFKPAIGGLAVGVIGYFLPEILGMGYGWVQMAINGNLPLRVAVAIVVFKIVATGLTISSGGSGGVFAPSIAIGGALGAIVGNVTQHFFPGIVTQPGVFVLVGMAGFFAGVAKAPVASLVMVSEMTMGYGLLVPLMLTTAVAYLLTPRKLGIYENQVPNRIDSPAHEGEFVIDVLERIQVDKILVKDRPVTTFGRGTPLLDILSAAVATTQQVFPITDRDSKPVGLIDFQDIRVFLIERHLIPELLVAQDLRSTVFDLLYLDEDLASALRKLQAVALPELPVVNSREPNRIVGMLSRRDVIAAYHQRMYANPAG